MVVTRTTVINGLTFIIKCNDTFISRSLETYGEWSFGEIRFLSQILMKSDSIIEAGANIGAHTVFLAKDLVPEGKVFAFEPRRILFQTLCGNIAINGIENVNAFQIGLGEKADMMREAKMDFGCRLNAGAYALGDLPGTDEDIKIERLDDIINPSEHISLIKADIEGYELKLLKGAENLILRDRPFLYLENDRIEQSAELLSYLLNIQYDIWWDIVPLFNPNNRAGNKENIFPNISSFNIFCAPSEKNLNVTGLKVEDPKFHPLIRSE